MNTVVDPSFSSPEIAAAGQTILRCYQELQNKSSNVVGEILQHHDHFFQWDHYPPGDIQDKKTSSQYYYHSHPSKDADRLPEHGHFHLFIRKPGIPNHLQPVRLSEKNKANPNEDNLCHLFAISMNAEGYPTALFTTNHWVTAGMWYSAEDVMTMLDYFCVQRETPFPLTTQWINAMVTFFKPHVKELLLLRDEIIEEWKMTHTDGDVFEDRRLEVLSILKLAE